MRFKIKKNNNFVILDTILDFTDYLLIFKD